MAVLCSSSCVCRIYPFRSIEPVRRRPAQDDCNKRGAVGACGSPACAASAFGRGGPLSNTLFMCASLAAGLKYRGLYSFCLPRDAISNHVFYRLFSDVHLIDNWSHGPKWAAKPVCVRGITAG